MAEKTDLCGFMCMLLLFALLISGIVVMQTLPAAFEASGSAFASGTVQSNSLAHQNSIGSAGPGHFYNADAGRCFWICSRGRCYWDCPPGWAAGATATGTAGADGDGG